MDGRLFMELKGDGRASRGRLARYSPPEGRQRAWPRQRRPAAGARHPRGCSSQLAGSLACWSAEASDNRRSADQLDNGCGSRGRKSIESLPLCVDIIAPNMGLPGHFEWTRAISALVVAREHPAL